MLLKALKPHVRLSDYEYKNPNDFGSPKRDILTRASSTHDSMSDDKYIKYTCFCFVNTLVSLWESFNIYSVSRIDRMVDIDYKFAFK